jgi:C4-dicarboxylate-specific signal transduction histidine kinase
LDSFERILMMTDRIMKIVRGMRVFSQDSSQDPYLPFELKKVVGDATQMVKEKFATLGIDFQVDVRPELLIKCRSIEISQVILNLFSNSVDAIRNLPVKWVRVRAVENEQSVFLYIADSGGGIPSAIADKVLQPFFTTKEVGKGTGLGLSMSAGVMLAHSGRLYLNRESPNTEFVLEFPRVASGMVLTSVKKAA